MPNPGKRWYHVTIGTYNSWLPGDPRGFRARDHKIHSSGHHKNPPPEGEHAGLHQHSQSISQHATVLPAELRGLIAHKLAQQLEKHGIRILIVSVGGMHAHLLAELPDDGTKAKRLIGITKKGASQAVNKQLPGRMWARGCGLKLVRDQSHQQNTFHYIKRHENDGAFVWTFTDNVRQGD